MGTVYVYAKLNGYPVYGRVSLREFLAAFGQAFLALMTPAIIVGGIVGGFFTPTEASVIAVTQHRILVAPSNGLTFGDLALDLPGPPGACPWPE